MKKLIYTFAFVLIVHCTLYIENCSAQWSEQTSGVTTVLYSISAVDNNVVWICGAGGKVLRTTNGGTNWNLTTSPNAALDLYNICGIDVSTALVTGSGTTAYVYKTTNGGANWTQVFSQAGGFINVIVKLVTGNFVICGDPVGGRWSAWHSDNNGSTWDSSGLYIPQAGSETGYNNSAFDISAGNNDYFWFGTNNTRIYRGYSGQNWISQPTPGQANSLVIAFVTADIGFAGGSTGLLYTSNGGSIWSDLPGIPGSGSINGLAFTNTIGELFFTRGSSVYRTTSGGINWSVATTQTGTYTHMRRARASDNYNIWAIRNNGGISKYVYSVGITPISSEVPSKYSLLQNYPNPFNPTTVISFQLPVAGQVSLKIYDMLGREVATLVNELLQHGTYEVNWNASQYPSGIYFYRLQTEGFGETKKMTLIK